MPAPGSFSQKRKAFLVSKRPYFAAAVDNKQTTDGLAIICRQYFKRFPVDLDDNEEPSDETLAAVDDDAPDPDVEEPSDSLSPAEYLAALEALKDRQSRIKTKRDQITRWFTYRYSRDNDVDPRSNDPKNPYNRLLLQLTGNIAAAKPRRKSPVNVWVHDQSSTQPIKDEIQQILNSRHIEQKQMVAVRSEAARAAFQKLPEADQERWKNLANDEYVNSIAEYEQVCKEVVSTSPQDRQRAISGLVRFVQPILDQIALATGFKISLFAGGPEPARQGRLSLVSMHSGTTGGDIPLNFGQAERVAYVKHIMPIWGRFMRACYTPEECRSRALQSGSAQDTLQPMATNEAGMTFHSLGIPETVPSTSTVTSQPDLPLTPDSPSTPVSRPSMPVSTPLNSECRQSGIAGLTEAIRSVSRRIEESVTQSATGSPALSVIPSPIGSVAPSPTTTSTKRARALSAKDSSPKCLRPSTPSASSCVAPPGAPSWVSNAVNMFVSEPLEGRWHELIAAWLVYEERCNFDGKKLSPKGHPKVVADWIKWARKPTWRPSSFEKAVDFGHQHTSWWRSLQPAWRVVDDATLDRSGDGGWDSLHVGGVNGLLSALASLFFWALAIQYHDRNVELWNTIVDDTLFVIQQLTRAL